MFPDKKHQQNGDVGLKGNEAKKCCNIKQSALKFWLHHQGSYGDWASQLWNLFWPCGHRTCTIIPLLVSYFVGFPLWWLKKKNSRLFGLQQAKEYHRSEFWQWEHQGLCALTWPRDPRGEKALTALLCISMGRHNTPKLRRQGNAILPMGRKGKNW